MSLPATFRTDLTSHQQPPQPGYEIPLMVFDVESIGLHGEGFAVGYIVVHHGAVLSEHLLCVHPDTAIGQPQSRQWVMENVWPQLLGAPLMPAMTALREAFWAAWDAHRLRGGQLMADCPWPVEANFLGACIAQDPGDRYWKGPYPLLDAQSLRTYGRARPTEDVHHPLRDAIGTWQSVK